MEHQLNGELVAAFAAARPDDQRLHRAASILRDDPAELRKLLGLVASDPRFATKVARDSYWHANGFAKLTLHRSTEQAYKLRMHVWTGDHSPTAVGVGSSNTHTHRWSFSSILLTGALSVEEFEEIDDCAEAKAVPCHKFAYESPEANVAGALRPLGPCLLRPTGAAFYEAGDIHDGTLETIHRVAPVDTSTTATLFVQGPTRRASAFVYQEPGHVPLEDTGATIEPTQVMELADLVLTTLPATNARKR